jgi:hypothetical protein
MVYPFSPPLVLTYRVYLFPVSTTSRMDVQGVFLFTTSRMDVQGVFLFTTSRMDVQGVFLSTASSMDVQGVPHLPPAV